MMKINQTFEMASSLILKNYPPRFLRCIRNVKKVLRLYGKVSSETKLFPGLFTSISATSLFSSEA